MKKNLVNRINNETKNYELAFNSVSRDEYNGKLDHAWKKIRSDFQYDSMNSYSDYTLGTKRHHSLSDRPSLEKNERPTYASYKKMCMERKETMVTGLLAIYLAAEKKLNERSFWDKVLHPIDTYRENKSFDELKETMENYGITEEVIQDYKDSSESVTIDDAERFSEEVDLKDEKPEMEEFVNTNTEARIDAIYLV